MIGRLALRSLTAHPIRSAVLAAGFGAGVAVMAILLGVAEIVLEQARSPDLAGGGDVLVRLSRQLPAQVLLSGTLQSDALRTRVRTASPSHDTDLYLFSGDGPATRVDARGGIPSLERALGDPETVQVEAWRDAAADRAWVDQDPEAVLRRIDAFHAIPDAPAWQASWAEWLYFNGRSAHARFYLTFTTGPRLPNGRRAASVRLQLERDGRTETFSAAAQLTDAEVQRAPDLTIGSSSVRLDGLRYRIHVDLAGSGTRRITGDLTLASSPGRLVPPFEVAGARGWKTGYVVPVTSGDLAGTLDAGDGPISLEGGTGYHDHNWGFWQGVTWQWGQVQHDDVSVLYGRVLPPPDAADPERIPGFVGVLGPDGPLGYATDLQITETSDALGRPETIRVRAAGATLDLTLLFQAGSVVRTRLDRGPLGNDVDFLQMRGTYTVTGRAAAHTLGFTAPGAAETFRGPALR